MAKLERFYNTFQPDHYDVFIDINRAKKIINGKTTITGNANDPQIAINQKNLQVTSVQADGQELDFNIDNDAEAVRITLPQTGKVTFTVTYNTKLTDSMMGIYPSYYEVDGEKKQIIGTQFETTFARQAFPCVDEPEAKAIFILAKPLSLICQKIMLKMVSTTLNQLCGCPLILLPLPLGNSKVKLLRQRVALK